MLPRSLCIPFHRLRSGWLFAAVAWLATGPFGLVHADEPAKPTAGPASFVCTGRGPEGKAWFNGLAPTEAADASANYVSLLPGEVRTIGIKCAAKEAAGVKVSLDGWNVVPAELTL